MLILTRRPPQVIMIGDDIQIKVISVDRGQVRIGVSAPKGVTVHREEVYARMQREEKKAH